MAGTNSGGLGGVGSVGLLLLAAVVAGCDGGGDLGPMSGRQLLQGRDVKDMFFWRERTLAFSRDTADPSQPEPQDFLVWPLDDPAPTVALGGVNWTYPTSWPVWFTGDMLVTGAEFERVYSLESRQAANLLSLIPPSSGSPETYRQLLATIELRSDGHALAKLRHGVNVDTIVVGRPPELRAFSLPHGNATGAMTFLGADLALLIGRSTEAGDVVGVQRLDTSSGALTPLVAETPAAEWKGVTGFCDDVEPPERCGLFGALGCGVNEPACADGHRPPCLLLYSKADPDDDSKVATYVHDVGTATTTRLAGDDIERFFSDRKSHVLAWGSQTTDVTNYWNLCTDTKGTCPFAPGLLVAWRPDGGAFAMFGPDEFLNIVDVDGGACLSPDMQRTYGVYQVRYAPGSDRLMWVSANDPDGTSETLWLADRDGQSPVALAGGPSLGGTFSADGRLVYLSHSGESTSSLGWIDPAASPPVEQLLSTNCGDVGLLGNRRALFIDHYNAQDGNGELVLVELATGARQSLARAVTGVSVAGGKEAEGTDVAYTVRGRAAASRDGLWQTTMPP